MDDWERELRKHLSSADLDAFLKWLQAHGSSVLLGWGEDDGLWECSWITGGRRFTAHSKLPGIAVFGAARQALPDRDR